ncbi:MAG: hypothetical protein AAF702_13905 [Chloroflexota bacterium]
MPFRSKLYRYFFLTTTLLLTLLFFSSLLLFIAELAKRQNDLQGSSMVTAVQLLPASLKAPDVVGKAAGQSTQREATQQTLAGVESNQNLANRLHRPELSLLIEGPAQATLNQPAVFTSSVISSTGEQRNTVYPIQYRWMLDQTPSSLFYVANEITSTATVTWRAAGLRVLGLSADTSMGEVTRSVTVAVSAISPLLTSNQPMTFSYTSFTGREGITIQVPAQPMSRPIQLAYLPLSGLSSHVELGYLGQPFQLTGQSEGTTIERFDWERPIALTIRYDDKDMHGRDEEQLTLRRWNGTDWIESVESCSPPSAYVRFPDSNQLEVSICEFGQYALFGVAARLYVPLLLLD